MKVTEKHRVEVHCSRAREADQVANLTVDE